MESSHNNASHGRVKSRKEEEKEDAYCFASPVVVHVGGYSCTAQHHPCLAVFMPTGSAGTSASPRFGKRSILHFTCLVVSSVGIDDDKELTELNAEDWASVGTYQSKADRSADFLTKKATSSQT